MSAAYWEECSLEAEECTPEMGMTVAILEERVNNHIRIFWKVIGGAGLWLAAISGTLYHINGTMNRVEQAQANAPAQIVASLLKAPSASRADTSDTLSAVSTILRTAKSKEMRPDKAVLNQVSSEISKIQGKYPGLPSVWQATSAFINYKSDALLSPTSKTPTIAKGVPCKTSVGGQLVFSNCEIDLEDLSQQMADNTVNGQPMPFIFMHCIIRYHGGPIVRGHLTFDDCLFRFDVQVVPPSSGRLAMERLTIIDTGEHIDISL